MADEQGAFLEKVYDRLCVDCAQSQLIVGRPFRSASGHLPQ
jgi:hypothetical protein